MSGRARGSPGDGRARSSGSRAPGELRGRRSPSADVAAVLAILIPGLGHLYAGRPRAAALWGLAILLGYWAVYWPGLVLHGLSIVAAGRAAASRGGGRDAARRPANP
ncbi:MAG: DUF6677 family protein [Myxococcota bacterium]